MARTRRPRGAARGSAGRWRAWHSFGEGGLLEDAAAGLLFAFDGRLDNRDGAAARLAGRRRRPLRRRAGFRRLARLGRSCLPRLLGPYALVVAAPAERKVWLARDPVGHRGLAFHLPPRLLLAASDEHAVAADPRVGRALDPAMVALYCSLEDRVDGRTFFRHIQQVLPGESWCVGSAHAERRLFYRPRLDSPIRRSEEWQEELRATLREAVACRLRGADRVREREGVGILLSGGLDSSADRRLRPRGPAWRPDRFLHLGFPAPSGVRRTGPGAGDRGAFRARGARRRV